MKKEIKEYQLHFRKNGKEYIKNVKAENIDKDKEKIYDIYDGVDRINGWKYV